MIPTSEGPLRTSEGGLWAVRVTWVGYHTVAHTAHASHAFVLIAEGTKGTTPVSVCVCLESSEGTLAKG